MANCGMLREDMVAKILVKLPVITLLRLRTVFKPWCALIDNSSFVNQHLLHHHYNSNDTLLVQSLVHPLGSDCFLLSGQHFEVRANLDLRSLLPKDPNPSDPFYNNDDSWRLVASCNGIVCLSNVSFTLRRPPRLALWNPATRQLRCLPEPQLLPPSSRAEPISLNLGFGYAASADDYRVVRILEFKRPNNFVVCHKVEAYSLRFNCWRNIDVHLPSGPWIYSPETAYWNGHYCWKLCEFRKDGTGRKQSILTFDLSNEVFGAFQLPDVLAARVVNAHLTTMSDFIAYIDSMDHEQLSDRKFDIWVMTQYGVKESWTKTHTITLIRPFTCVELQGFSNNGEVMLLRNHLPETGLQLAFSDIKTGEINNLRIRFLDYAVHKESLVSLK